jgi:hypothetical protein
MFGFSSITKIVHQSPTTEIFQGSVVAVIKRQTPFIENYLKAA